MIRRCSNEMLGLYLHVPFCSAICNYCNFNRGLFDAGLKERYVAALIAEIERTGKGEQVDSVYFGGGTPSLLEPEEVGRIVETCRSAFVVVPDCEVTLEANPETVTLALLEGFRRAGVNRLSYGAQSFRNEELHRLSRMHDAQRVRGAVHEARAVGFDNVSLDLMMWLPGQSVADWLESIDQAIRLGPDHVSLYLLELYPQAPIRWEMGRHGWLQAPDEDAAAMYLTALDRLDGAGYRQYEISNVARPGRHSVHNVKYWSDGEWQGLGCGAHSTRDGVRWMNVAGTEEYVERILVGRDVTTHVRPLSTRERLGDAMFTGLRLVTGVDELAVQARYGVDIWKRYGPELQAFVDEGMLERADGRIRLSRQGMLLAHEIMAVFV